MASMNHKRLTAMMHATAAKPAERLMIAECRRVMAMHPKTLGYYVDAMGSQFFCSPSGDIIHDEQDLPKAAREFMRMAEEHYEWFRSMGIQIHPDKLVLDW